VAEIPQGSTDLGEAKSNAAAISRDEKRTHHRSNRVVGVAHAYVCPKKKQLWIEGIRVDSKYRRNGIASMLINRMIRYGNKFDSNIKQAAAITAESNAASKCMLQKNRFQERAKWDFYTRYKENSNHQTDNSSRGFNRSEIGQNYVHDNYSSTVNTKMEVSMASRSDIEDIITFLSRSRTFISSGRRYVQSWKWYELSLEKSTISELTVKEKIIVVRTSGTEEIRGLAITDDYSRQNEGCEQSIAGDKAREENSSEDAAGHDLGDESGNDDNKDNDSASFQLVYIDVPSPSSLEKLMAFVLDRVASLNTFDRIQLFMPNRMYYDESRYYEVSHVLTKFGFSRSEEFLLYIRSI
jgi:N-acetylglutamate synthase-like GNAT family acetyltransferase